MLANTAHFDAEGLLHVDGAVWEFVQRTHFPTRVAGCLVMVLELDEHEFERELPLSLVFSDPHGESLGPAAPFVVRSARRRRTPVVLGFDIEIASPGTFAVEVHDRSGPLGRVDCA